MIGRARAHRTCLLAALLPLAALGQVGVESLVDNGDPANRIDLVVLGDGYRDVDQGQLSEDVLQALFGPAGLFALAPFDAYQSLFNVRLIRVLSNENGADDGSYGASRDTALGAYFNCAGIDRLLCVDDATVYALAAEHTPEFDLLVVLVNDPKYGGAGGGIATASTHALATEILRHELGHSVANLADEYEDAYPGFASCTSSGQVDCPEPNATLQTQRAAVKWSAWIDPVTPVPTPEAAGHTGIGVFEGCRYQSKGVYRPQESGCLMRSLQVPFCAVCAEGVVTSLWRWVSPIDAVAPPTNRPAVISACGPVTFEAFTPPLGDGAFSLLWTLGGLPVEGEGPRLTLSTADLPPGDHQVAVTVTDLTAYVRNDPEGLLSASRGWTATVGACAPGVCQTAAACDDLACVIVPEAEGTSCGAKASCQGTTWISAEECDGEGGCRAAQTGSCLAYRCDEEEGRCRESCTSAEHCAAEHHCEEGACVPTFIPPVENLSCMGCGAAPGALPGALWLAAVLLLRRRTLARLGRR